MPFDYSRYVNLRAFDVSPTDIYFDAIEYAKLALPEFQLRQGTPEDAIIQAISYISALNIAAVNRLPDRLMSGILGMMGVVADEGERATIDVEFTGIDHDGTVVPIGTIVRYDYEYLGDQVSIYFETIEEGVIDAVEFTGAEPLPSVVVEARALDVGVILPIGDGLEFSIETPTSNISSAKISGDVISLGRNPETSDEFLDRAVKYLGSLSSSFARASQIDGFALSEFSDTVSRCKAYDLTNPGGDQLWGGPNEPGYVTVYTYGIGRQMTEDEKVDLLIEIQSRSVAGLEIAINEVSLPTIEVSIDASYQSDYEPTIVEENIKAVVSQYFSPENYRFTDIIRLSEFYAIVASVPGVIYVTSVSISTPDFELAEDDGSGNISFFRKGTLPITPYESISVTLTSVDA